MKVLKKFIKKLLILTLVSSILIVGYYKFNSIATKKYNGINTADQINMSFKNSIESDYNCYFLGNSRIYRDINPEKFTSVKSYNFAHDNDSYNQMYYKLCYLLENNKDIDYLIIGTDYFQFSFLSDTRNYVYSMLFPKSYSEDFGVNNGFQIITDYILSAWSNTQNGIPSCISFILRKEVPKNIKYQKENGQYIVEGHALGTETIDRDYSVLQIQYDYYIKIIELCEKENIDLYVIMPPLWEGETASHTENERDEFNDMILNSLDGTIFKDNYINYSEEVGYQHMKTLLI
jgi:hypothetical protein